MPFPSARERVDHLEQTITELKRLYADPEHKPAPVRPAGPPLLLGRPRRPVAALAAEHADIIGFTGTVEVRRTAVPPIPASAEDIEERVEFVRSKLGGRDAEFNLLCHFVNITDDRAAGARRAGEADVGAC